MPYADIRSAVNDLTSVVPDLARLVDAVQARASHQHSAYHGGQHWRCVARTGLEILRHEPRADAAVVFLFALFHDAMRVNDDGDRGHGARGGALAREFHRDLFHLGEERLRVLAEACVTHTGGRSAPNLTVGVCWDADRLNLWRVGTVPAAHWLSTEYAKRAETIAWARTLQDERFEWAELYREFAAL